MARIPPAIESQYVNHTKDDLREAIGELHEKLVRLKEKMKADPFTSDLKAKIKDHEDEHYKPTMRRLELHLAAVRQLAKARGIRYE